MITAPSQTYRIQSHGQEFVTGLLSDRGQVLLVPTSESRIAQLLFDSEGFLISAEERIGDLNDEHVVFGPMLGGSEPAMRPGAILVLEFSVPKYGIGIRRHPESFDDFLAAPEATEPDERYRERTYRQIREWNEESRFVLTTWGKEYWMNADGSVFAT